MYNCFTYGGVHSSTYGISCNRETHSLLPELRKYTTEVVGKDGEIDFKIGGYGPRAISLELYYKGDYANLRASREQIIAWLSSNKGESKQLAFDDQPDRYYLAKIYSAIDLINDPTSDSIGTIVFICNPPWQYKNGILLTPEEIVWNTIDSVDGNQYIKRFTESGTVRLTNTGSLPVKPVIKLFGHIPSGTKLTYGAFTWQYDAEVLYDGIIIDCNNETVTLASDGSNIFSNVNRTYDDYFELASGQIEITVTATGLSTWPNSLDVIIQFNPINLG